MFRDIISKSSYRKESNTLITINKEALREFCKSYQYSVFKVDNDYSPLLIHNNDKFLYKVKNYICNLSLQKFKEIVIISLLLTFNLKKLKQFQYDLFFAPKILIKISEGNRKLLPF